MMSDLEPLLPDHLESLIVILRGQRVILSHHLASLYETETKILMQAVRRNTERFPVDFMFQLTDEESKSLRSQFVTSRLSSSDDNFEDSEVNLRSQTLDLKRK